MADACRTIPSFSRRRNADANGLWRSHANDRRRPGDG
jgi:hypothetical protein